MHRKIFVVLLSLIFMFASRQKAALGELIPEVGKTSPVCLQSWMGTFVSVDNGRGGLLVVNSPDVKRTETFQMKRIDDTHFTFQASNGKFVNARNGGGSIVIAAADEPLGSEQFKLHIGGNGLVSLSAKNGLYLRAEKSGILLANWKAVNDQWESFRIMSPSHANREYTPVIVNVYKIGTAPFWHTGTVIDGREYYFQTSNKVESCEPKGMSLSHHRTIERLVPGNLKRVKAVQDSVVNRWNGTRYDVAKHNCDFFTDDLLQSLGAPGLDQEYLNASGVAKGLRQIPGGATAQELLVKWPVKDKRTDKAFMEDVQRLAHLPDDTRKEAEKASGKVADDVKKARDSISNEANKAGKGINKARKKIGL
jgi:hypothetical protein